MSMPFDMFMIGGWSRIHPLLPLRLRRAGCSCFSILQVDGIVIETGRLECWHVDVSVADENKEWELKKSNPVFEAYEYEE